MSAKLGNACARIRARKALLWVLPLLLGAPAHLAGAKKEYVQLQREIALVDDRVRTLQRTVDERMGAMLALIRQTLDRVNEIHTADAVMRNAVDAKLNQQEKTLGRPVAAFGETLGRVASDTPVVPKATGRNREGRLRCGRISKFAPTTGSSTAFHGASSNATRG